MRKALKFKLASKASQGSQQSELNDKAEPFFKPATGQPAINRTINDNAGAKLWRNPESDEANGKGSSSWHTLGEIFGGILNSGNPYGGVMLPFTLQDKGLPRRLLMHYLSMSKQEYILSVAEMKECQPIIDFSGAKHNQISDMALAANKPMPIFASVQAKATQKGTLNNFTVYYAGMITPQANGTVEFTGTMFFHDSYDFNKFADRTRYGHFATGFGNSLPGSPFEVNSEVVPVTINGQGLPDW